MIRPLRYPRGDSVGGVLTRQRDCHAFTLAKADHFGDAAIPTAP
jgi:hypothetical protein